MRKYQDFFIRGTKKTWDKQGFMRLFLPFFLAAFMFPIYVEAQAFHIYGGKNHDVYLGCLNCSKYDTNSIWNSYGDYGSKYSSKSIWNNYGDYGSTYSNYSPFNVYASYPPVIVDRTGNSYGYFTCNTANSKSVKFDLANIIYKYYNLIRDNVSDWYDEIF